MIFVISPSKTQTLDVSIHDLYTHPVFSRQAGQLVEQLQQLDQAELGTLMKMSDKLAAVNYQRFRNFQLPFNSRNSRQALFMFQGDQFNPMDVERYSKEQLVHAQEHLRILSGLYGILRPLDLMQPYRLEMAVKLAVGGAKNLYGFWGERITRAVNEELLKDPFPVLVNLASAEYFKVIRKKEMQADILTLSFKQKKDGRLKTIAIYAKRARGAMVDFIVKNKIINPEELKGFATDGYAFKPDLSAGNNWIFVRKLP
jgi:cytoplasmic iron level regulating protein YaaA (DUF328/UPF0246 family)